MPPSFWEFDHSPTEQYGDEGAFLAKRRLHCEWGDRYALVSYFASYPGNLYPYNMTLGAYAVGATIIPFNDNPQPLTGNTTRIQYDTAVVTITYAVSPYYPRAINGRMVLEELHPYLEYRTIPKENLHVGSVGGDAPDSPARVLVSGFDYSYTASEIANVSVDALGFAGSINVAPWNMFFYNASFPAETLFYVGCAPSVSVRLGLSPSNNIKFLFKYRPISWNKELTDTGWQYIFNDAGQKLYTENNFLHLLPTWV